MEYDNQNKKRFNNENTKRLDDNYIYSHIFRFLCWCFANIVQNHDRGYIIDSQIVGDKTEITVMQTPLNWRGKPQFEDKSEGRFLVSYEGTFNPDDYSPRDRFTVAGKIAGITKEKLESCPSPCLKIESSKLRVWREYEYYPPMIRGT